MWLPTPVMLGAPLLPVPPLFRHTILGWGIPAEVSGPCFRRYGKWNQGDTAGRIGGVDSAVKLWHNVDWYPFGRLGRIYPASLANHVPRPRWTVGPGKLWKHPPLDRKILSGFSLSRLDHFCNLKLSRTDMNGDVLSLLSSNWDECETNVLGLLLVRVFFLGFFFLGF